MVYLIEQQVEPSRLFVYGTLRNGCGNHSLMQGATHLGDGSVKGRLFVSGMLPMLGHGKLDVRGELYNIPSQEEWRYLDSLEGHPNWYCRELVDVTLDNGKTEKAWVYFMTSRDFKDADLLESGDYADFRRSW